MAIATTTLPSPTDAVLPALEDVTSREKLHDVARKLAGIRRWLADDLGELERALGGVSAGTDLAEKSAAYLLGHPGKRIRPLCVMLSARIGPGAEPHVVRDLAVACELVHTATLLHDDVIDEGTERRGATTARMIYGNTASVLGGDFLLVEALKRVQASGPGDLVAELLEVIADMVRAEAIQLAHRGDFRPDRERYHAVVNGKTASLFHWAMRAGAVASGARPIECEALAEAGRNLGIAFQLIDDTLDLVGDPALVGKDLYVDLREGKLTWPLLLACERDASLAQAIRHAVKEPSTEGLGFLVKRIVSTGCVEATQAYAREMARDASVQLAQLPPSPGREALSAVVESAIGRTN